MARVDLDALPYGTGKKTRLHRLLYEHGPGNGTCLLLPIDHGLEHGPIDFLDNPDALDPTWDRAHPGCPESRWGRAPAHDRWAKGDRCRCQARVHTKVDGASSFCLCHRVARPDLLS